MAITQGSCPIWEHYLFNSFIFILLVITFSFHILVLLPYFHQCSDPQQKWFLGQTRRAGYLRVLTLLFLKIHQSCILALNNTDFALSALVTV